MSTTLVVIYNHSFPSNIDKIERYYRGNFSQIFHVIPFFLTERKNVIPVFEISYMFVGHISSAWSQIIKSNSDYYAFIGDDLVLNPKINEKNFPSVFRLDPERAYIDEIFTLDKVQTFWRRAVEAISWLPTRKGVQLPSFFPSAEDMLSKLSDVEPTSTLVPRKAVYQKFVRFSKGNLRNCITTNVWRLRRNVKFFSRHARQLKYPVVGGYSDFVAIPRRYVSDFCSLCGIFNVLGLHTELAIPTILRYLFGKSISTAENVGISRLIAWDGHKAIEYLGPEKTIESLREMFPADLSYAHPVKLSEWQ